MRVADQVMGAMGESVPYLMGTMIELPRAALTADQIAVDAEFFSFGTNDLTQTVFGLSRDDAGPVPAAVSRAGDSWPTIRSRCSTSAGSGHSSNPRCSPAAAYAPVSKVGICGEHGGEPRSVTFCHRIGLDYVSCSPFRVPVARLAAAQAALAEPAPTHPTS